MNHFSVLPNCPFNAKLLLDIFFKKRDHYTVAGFDYRETLEKLVTKFLSDHEKIVVQISKNNKHDYERDISSDRVYVVRGKVPYFACDEKSCALITEYDCPYSTEVYIPWKTNICLKSVSSYNPIICEEKILLPVYYLARDRTDRSKPSYTVILAKIPKNYGNVRELNSGSIIAGFNGATIKSLQRLFVTMGSEESFYSSECEISNNFLGQPRVGNFMSANFLVVTRNRLKKRIGDVINIFCANHKIKLIVLD